MNILPIINMYTKSYITKLSTPANCMINRSINDYVKNNNICSNCIYYKDAIIEEESICFKFGKKSLDKNYINFHYSKDCRNDETKCGKEGKYYTSKLLK